MTDYVTMAPDRETLTEPPEVTIFVQDLTPGQHKYTGDMIRAQVSETLGPEVLWRRTGQGNLDPEPLRLTILQRLGVSIRRRPFEE